MACQRVCISTPDTIDLPKKFKQEDKVRAMTVKVSVKIRAGDEDEIVEIIN